MPRSEFSEQVVAEAIAIPNRLLTSSGIISPKGRKASVAAAASCSKQDEGQDGWQRRDGRRTTHALQHSNLRLGVSFGLREVLLAGYVTRSRSSEGRTIQERIRPRRAHVQEKCRVGTEACFPHGGKPPLLRARMDSRSRRSWFWFGGGRGVAINVWWPLHMARSGARGRRTNSRLSVVSATLWRKGDERHKRRVTLAEPLWRWGPRPHHVSPSLSAFQQYNSAVQSSRTPAPAGGSGSESYISWETR
ncbi:hypothetical protein CDD83_2314 [Cordyceps sp. RAO-2017]|nr:hypothetical protein CDD83_2314 [Cordyceps sp. RAO-2017]